MKCLLLSVDVVRLGLSRGEAPPVVWSQRCDSVLSVSLRAITTFLSSESKGCFKFPWQQNALGGQTHQISEQ